MPVTYASRTGKAVIAAAALGSGMTFLDASILNVAVPAIGREFSAPFSGLQWVLNGYLLSLSAFILLGGALGDRWGRVRTFGAGTVAFALASVLCGVAPTMGWLIGARVLQGLAAAVLTPASLAMLQGAFTAEDRPVAIGAWSGLSGVTTAAGPFVGGLLVDHGGWRWIFLLNLPLAALALAVAWRWVPESRDPEGGGRFDVLGALLAAVALALVTWGLIDLDWPLGLAGLVAAAGWLWLEHRRDQPMVPLGLFRDRVFTGANAMTTLVYAALGAVTLFLTLLLIGALGYSAVRAGLATLPITLCLLLLAARGGRLAARIGPRIPMTLGPLVLAGGTAWLTWVDRGSSYLRDVLPGVVVFGLGLALMVAPLTATVLAAAPDRLAGLASGINNAVARTGSLLAVAALPPLVGLRGAAYDDPVALAHGYRLALWICVGILLAGALVSWLLIPGRVGERSRHP